MTVIMRNIVKRSEKNILCFMMNRRGKGIIFLQ